MAENQDLNSKSKWLAKLALWCGLGPLLVGTAIFIAWLITDNIMLPILGLYTIMAGLILFVIGHIALVLFWFKARPAFSTLLLPALLLFLNFPAAAFFMSYGYDSYFGTYVEINNNCKQRAKVELTGPSGKVKTIAIEGLGRANLPLNFSGDGAIKYRLFIADKLTQKGTAIGYVSDFVSFKLFFRIDQKCNLKVSSKIGRSKQNNKKP